MYLRSRYLQASALGLLLVLAACDDGDGFDTDALASDTDALASDTAPAETLTADTTPADTLPTDTSVADTLPTDTTAVSDTAAPACDRQGFVAVAQDAGSFGFAFVYVAQDSLGEPVSVLTFELVPTNGGATVPGTYPLTAAPYTECGNCVLAYVGCDGNLDNCAKTFLAQAGTLTITSFGDSEGQFTGTLDDVVLAEITIDASSYASTLVPGGETWCLDSYAFDVAVQ